MVKRKKNNRKRQASRSGKIRTPISGHQRVGGQLLPPFEAIINSRGNVQVVSWTNERLPEMVWAALIVASVDRDLALAQFRRILNFIAAHPQREQSHDLTLTGIAQLEERLRNELIRFIVGPPALANALSALRLFDALPGKEEWHQNLPVGEPDIELLMQAIGITLWHQSEAATDCRWVKVMANMFGGKLSGPQNIIHSLANYPHEYNGQPSEGIVRTLEMQRPPYNLPDLTWPKAFWSELWEKTPCFDLGQPNNQPLIREGVTRQSIADLHKRLLDHWAQTHATTETNPKHDAVFGMAYYCLRIIDEMIGIGIGTSVLGRLGLRTISEIRINLKYLLSRDNADLWKKWREYGAGQAKLHSLKFDDLVEPPRYIDVVNLEQIANEDMWEEFLTVNLANWINLDLPPIHRKDECSVVGKG